MFRFLPIARLVFTIRGVVVVIVVVIVIVIAFLFSFVSGHSIGTRQNRIQ